MPFHTATLRIAILAVLCGTSISLAQGPPSDETLRGPKVNDRAVPGVSTDFGERTGKPDKFQRGDPRIAHRQFMDAIHSLEADDIAADLRITEDQLAQIDAIDKELRAALESFRADHQAEIDELRAKSGELRDERRERRSDRPEGPPTKEDKARAKAAKADPEVQAAKEKLKALKESGPKPEDYHTRMWAVLSAPQQALAQSRLDSMRDDRRERATDEMRERRTPRSERSPDSDTRPRGPRGGRPDGPPQPDGRDGAPRAQFDRAPRSARGDRPFDGPPPRRDFDRGPDGPRGEGFRDGPPPPRGDFDRRPRTDGGPDQRFRAERRGPDGPPQMRENFERMPLNPRFARLMDRFNELPPEAQDRIIERMEEMLSRMENRRGPKPPPPMDEVDVPPPPAPDDAGEPMPPPAPDHI